MQERIRFLTLPPVLKRVLEFSRLRPDPWRYKRKTISAYVKQVVGTISNLCAGMGKSNGTAIKGRINMKTFGALLAVILFASSPVLGQADNPNAELDLWREAMADYNLPIRRSAATVRCRP